MSSNPACGVEIQLLEHLHGDVDAVRRLHAGELVGRFVSFVVVGHIGGGVGVESGEET
jgi:hypothetical protein